MKEVARRIKRNLSTIILLTLCLFFITFQSAYADMTNKSHMINLNDDKPIIEEYDFIFSPGTKLERDFFIENTGDEALYYRLFFADIEGTLGEYLDVTILDGNETIAKGQMKDLQKNSTDTTERYLTAHERRQLHIIFTLPQNVSDEGKNKSVEFDLRAIAILAKDHR